MSIADQMPIEWRRASVLRQLKPGAVIKLRRQMDDGQTLEKRYVVVRADDTSIVCVINSRIGPFLKARPELLRCQVTIDATAHPFMDHDSHIDCSKVMRYRTTDVVDELVNEPAWILGSIAAPVAAGMISALKFAPTLSAADASAFVESLLEVLD